MLDPVGFLCGGCLIWIAYNGKDLMWFFWAFAGLAVLCGVVAVRVVEIRVEETRAKAEVREQL